MEGKKNVKNNTYKDLMSSVCVDVLCYCCVLIPNLLCEVVNKASANWLVENI